MKVMDRVPESAVTAKGQITIPKAAREILKIGPGDRVKFFFNAHGHLSILPVVPVSALHGIVKSRLGRPATLEEMERAPEEAASARYKRLREAR